MSYGLLGYKALLYEQGEIYSMSRHSHWERGSLIANCYKPKSDWPYTIYCCNVPERRCSCGIYATSPYPDTAFNYLRSAESILTLVRAHRKTVRHKLGWRAGRAEVVAVISPETYWFIGLDRQDIFPFGPMLAVAKEAASKFSVPLMDMITAQALVHSSWDYFTGRFQ